MRILLGVRGLGKINHRTKYLLIYFELKIAVDITPIEDNPAGIGLYSENIVRQLIALDKKNEYILYSSKPYGKIQAQNIVLAKSRILPFKGLIWMKNLVADLRRQKIDFLISPSNLLLARLFPKTIQFVYDLGPILYPQFFSFKSALFYKLLIRFALPRAHKIVTISETVKSEIIKYTKIEAAKISVAYPSSNENIKSQAIDFVDYNLPTKFILTISTLEPRKNISALLAGFKEYLTKFDDHELKLIIIGKQGWNYNHIFKTIEKLGILDKVIFTGYLEDRFIKYYLDRAKAFIYLSEYEGFGMPILEALESNIPVIVNDIPVFKECFAPYVVFADAHSPNIIGEAINTALISPHIPQFPLDKYTWQNSAQTLLKLLDS